MKKYLGENILKPLRSKKSLKCVGSLQSVKVVFQFLAVKRKVTWKSPFLMLLNSEAFKKGLPVKIYQVCSMPPRSGTKWAAYKRASPWQAFPLPRRHSAQSGQQLMSLSSARAITEQGWPGHTGSAAEPQQELLRDFPLCWSPSTAWQSPYMVPRPSSTRRRACPAPSSLAEAAGRTAGAGTLQPMILACGGQPCAVPSSTGTSSCSAELCWEKAATAWLSSRTANTTKEEAFFSGLMGTCNKWTWAIFSETENKKMLKT